MQDSITQKTLQEALSKEAYHAIALFRNGRPLDAISHLESHLKSSTNSSDYALLSDFYHALRNTPKALFAIQKAWSLDQANISIQLKLISLFLEAESFEFCEVCLREIDPFLYEAAIQFEIYALYANVLFKSKSYQKAFEKIGKALEINDRLFDVNYLAGMICYQLSDFITSKTYFEKALFLNPSHESALNYFSILEKILGREREAIWIYLKLLRINPELDGVRFNLGAILLTIGKYDLGWHFYESRKTLEIERLTSLIKPRLWKGESIDGKSLLVYSEQGCGDNLQFSRFLVDLKEKYNCTIIYIARGLNFKITQSLSDRIIFINEEDIKSGRIIIPKCDYTTPLLSILQYLKIREPQYQLKAPYLKPSQDRVNFYKEKINDLKLRTKFKVGLLWAGSKNYGNDKNRSFQATLYNSLFELKNVTFFKLQVNEKKHDLDNQPIYSLLPEDPDFNESAALIEHLDLVITVDTSIAHLAGAMFKPVYCLINKDPDWRWGMNDEKTNWYPTMTLFKQKIYGDWKEVIARIFIKLKTF